MPRHRPSTARPDALAALGTEPLALDPKSLRAFANGDAGAFLGLGFFDDDEPIDYYILDDRAVVPVMGCLWQRGCWWWSGYDTIERGLVQALTDDRVREVVLHIDSPGGSVAGLFDSVRRMRLAVEASGKRVTAVADERCYSAAYAIACVADEVIVPATAGAGSVGVIGTWVSWAEALKKEGVDVRVIASGDQKADGHPSLPHSDEAIAREQARVNALADVFFAWVAERRGMTVDAVKALQAGISLGADAVTAGLADRVATANDTMHGLLAPAPSPTPTAPDEGATNDRTNPMSLAAIMAALGAATPEAALAAAKTATARVDNLVALTGAKTYDEAIGTVTGWKHDSEAAAARAQSDAKAAADARVSERATLLAEGVKTLKLTPADAEQDGKPEGWTSSLTNDGLRAYLNRSASIVPTAPSPAPKGKPTAASLTAEQKAFADQMGLDHAKYAAALAEAE